MYHADNQWDLHGQRAIYQRNALIASSLPAEWLPGRPELQQKSWYLNRIDAQQLNAPSTESIRDWDDDIVFIFAPESRNADETDVAYLEWLKNRVQLQQYGVGHYPTFRYFQLKRVRVR